MNCYCISGLGAGKEVYGNLILPETWTFQFIEWLEPSAGETLADYCVRLSSVIDRSQPFVLVGVSFGGIVAQQLASFLSPQKLILISTFQSHKQFPWFFRMGNKPYIRPVLFRFIPLKANRLLDYLFGAKTDADKKVLDTCLRGTTLPFSKWSLKAMFDWKELPFNCDTVVIHGAADKVIRLKWVKPQHIVEGAGHLMLFSHAKEVGWLFD